MCLVSVNSKFRSEQFRFGEMLTQLQRREVFQLHEFEKVIDSIRDCVAEVSLTAPLLHTTLSHFYSGLQLLWSLLVEDADLAGHLKVQSPSTNTITNKTTCVTGMHCFLQLMKDIFLLGRGELFLAFVDLSHHFMSAPPSATTQHG